MEHETQSATDPAFVQNPYPAYARMRAAGPLVWWDAYDMPATTSYAVANAVFRDKRFGRENPAPPPRPAHQAGFWRVEDHSMLEAEPPRHTRLRAQVLRAFTSRSIQAMAFEIRDLAEALVRDLPSGPFDLLEHLARPLPVRVIARLLGVPEGDAPRLLDWSNNMVKMYQAGRSARDETDAARAADDFSAYMAEIFDHRRATPGSDLITRLLAVAQDGELSPEEMTATCILLLNAGHEATVHTLGNGILGMIETGAWGTDVTPALVEEVLRHDPPLHLFTRYANEPVELHGHSFASGDQIALVLGGTNRDPEVYAAPDQFDPVRFEGNAPVPLSFGAGIHFCLGAHLARLEIFETLQALTAACPRLEIAQAPVYADIYHFHGLRRLMVTAG